MWVAVTITSSCLWVNLRAKTPDFEPMLAITITPTLGQYLQLVGIFMLSHAFLLFTRSLGHTASQFINDGSKTLGA